MRRSVGAQASSLGLTQSGRRELGAAAAGEALDIQVLGLATVGEGVTPDPARAAIASVQVLGSAPSVPLPCAPRSPTASAEPRKTTPC